MAMETDSIRAVQISWLCSAGLGRDLNSGMGTCPQSLPGRVYAVEIRAPVFPKHKLGTTTPSQSVRDTQRLWCWHWWAQDLPTPLPHTAPAACCLPLPVLSEPLLTPDKAFQPRWAG